jgi:hypothetical protein
MKALDCQSLSRHDDEDYDIEQSSSRTDSVSSDGGTGILMTVFVQEKLKSNHAIKQI